MSNHPTSLSAGQAPGRLTDALLGSLSAEMQSALSESDASMDRLTVTLAELLESISMLTVEETGELDLTNQPSLRIDAIQRAAREAIVACQFYDRLRQRIEHASAGLGDLRELLDSPQSADDPATWERISGAIRSRFSMEQQAQVFQRALDAQPNPLETRHDAPPAPDNAIELF
ncbi:MAG: hypothetical protein ACPG4N_08885 [Gammaproteobacteria bacterium]